MVNHQLLSWSQRSSRLAIIHCNPNRLLLRNTTTAKFKFERSNGQNNKKHNKSRTVHLNDTKFTHENSNTNNSPMLKFQRNSSNYDKDIVSVI